MAANTYNIAKRAREWAKKCYTNKNRSCSSLGALSPIARTQLAKSVERLMHEAYNEGYELGHSRAIRHEQTGNEELKKVHNTV